LKQPDSVHDTHSYAHADRVFRFAQRRRDLNVRQDVRFCTAPDGVHIAYATLGQGTPLVKTANWLNHLEFDLESPVWRHWQRELSRDHLLVRYDERGCGLSDWDVAENSFDAWVGDLEAVVDAARLEQFALLGMSQGGPVAIAYAVRHAERVSHLILYGTYARGWRRRGITPEERAQREAMITLTRHGWGGEVPAFREPFTLTFIPDASSEQRNWFNELQRITCSPENAVRLQYAMGEMDVSDLLPQVTVPTLVLHARGDMRCPFDEGRAIAAAIPGSRFVSLEGRNHLLLEEEPAWPTFLRAVREFLGVAAEPSPVPAPREGGAVAAGDRLGPYEVLARLGAGGMGEVYRARDTRLDRTVAIKVIAGLVDETARRRLRDEARAAAALNHPNICTIHEIDEIDNRLFIVMELVDGRVLSELVSDRLPPAAAIWYGIQMADALGHAHERGVVHRDLKSANLMITPDDRVKVLDFGIARRVEQSRDTTASALQTLTGGVSGTPAYMAPETLRGAAADRRSDIWSLGVVLYEMVSARRPFAGETAFELSSAILRDQPQPLPSRVPARLRAAIARCLAKDPAERYQQAEEVRAAIRAAGPRRASKARSG
jgi:pimeloyl-ACP methyl ester carboxylesterase/tRNA A-37 threonylcarbamoyl transferase component Bud32